MVDRTEVDRVIGQDVYDSDGAKIGTAGQVYVDDDTDQPEWVTVRTGLFGTRESFVPLAEAQLSDHGLNVPYTKAFVKDAPNMDDDGHLTPQEEQDLYAYYGTGRGQSGVGDADRTAGIGQTEDDDQTVGDDEIVGDDRTGTGVDASAGRSDTGGLADATAGRGDAGAASDEAMTVSEERLNVGTERREAGRVRLRKYVVTENVTQTVPVEREEVRLEREPITDANAGDAVSGRDISEDEHEVVLHEERPVVEKETVPVERVRLDTETVTEQETVGGEVRQERVEVDDDTSTAADRRP